MHVLFFTSLPFVSMKLKVFTKIMRTICKFARCGLLLLSMLHIGIELVSVGAFEFFWVLYYARKGTVA
jgi:hypothetical protein